jgi:hypothetical protein
MWGSVRMAGFLQLGRVCSFSDQFFEPARQRQPAVTPETMLGPYLREI